jgi:subtilisin family serine protease
MTDLRSLSGTLGAALALALAPSAPVLKGLSLTLSVLALQAAVGTQAHAQADEDDDDDDDDDADDGSDDGDDDDAGGDDPGDDDSGDDPGDDGADDGDDGNDAGDDDAGGDDDGAGDGDDGPGGDDDGPGGDDDEGGGGSGADDDDDGPGGSDDDDAAPSGAASSRDEDEDDDSDNAQGEDDDDQGEAGPGELNGSPLGYDDEGERIRRSEILALDINAGELSLARELGFRVVDTQPLRALGTSLVRLQAPDDLNLADAIDRLSRAAPAAPFDYNHIFVMPEGEAPEKLGSTALAPIGVRLSGRGVKVGVIDTVVDKAHPALKGQTITTKDFAASGKRDTAHATAVASILVGEDTGEGYAGLLPGATLYAANIFTLDSAGKTATDAATMILALDWLAGQDVGVINMSIAGPSSDLLEEVVERLRQRGQIVVAAVGNDGPAAPPLYPAAFETVIGVTAVDLDGKVYRRAGRGQHVDFSAPGVRVKAAVAGGSYGAVTGTSFATPVVAGMMARLHPVRDAKVEDALKALRKRVRDLGSSGRDEVYGEGVPLVEASTRAGG